MGRVSVEGQRSIRASRVLGSRRYIIHLALCLFTFGRREQREDPGFGE